MDVIMITVALGALTSQVIAIQNARLDQEKQISCDINHNDAGCDEYIVRKPSAMTPAMLDPTITKNDTTHCIDGCNTSSKVGFAISDGQDGDCEDEKVADYAYAGAASEK